MIEPIDNDQRLCWKCLSESDHITTIEFGDLGYGSGFDGWSSKIQLCDICFDKETQRIWSLELIPTVFHEITGNSEYKYEDEMFDYLSRLPLESRELVENRYAYGVPIHMKPIDWIKYEVGELSHKQCKKYGLYSPKEISAYRGKFPTCGNVYKVVYKDGSSGNRCKYGASGRQTEPYDPYSVSTQCLKCRRYFRRSDDIKTLTNAEFNRL